MKRYLENLFLRCFSILYVCPIGKEMRTKFKNYKETSEDKGKCNLPFMTRLDSNVYKTFVMFFKSFQFSSELCFLGESSFEVQRRIKIFIFLNFTNEIYHCGNFFYEKMKQFFYETTFSWNNFLWNHFLCSERKKLPIIFHKLHYLLYLNHHNIEIASWFQWNCQGLWWPYLC